MIIKKEKETFEQYLTDASNYRGDAESLFIPESQEELIDFIKKSNSGNIPITISGAGTGLTGGRVPEGGIIISTEKLNKIISVDKDNLTITVQPGLLLTEMEEELNNYGLFYPVNPTEINASIGGNIATNASGSRTFKYGPTRYYVMSLKVILPDGELIELYRGEHFANGNKIVYNSTNGNIYKIEIPVLKMPSVKHAAGFYIKPNMDAIDLFIGSEGTLGIVSEVTLKLALMPEMVLGGIAFFENYDKLFGFVKKVREGSNKYEYNSGTKIIHNEENQIDARTVEFFDENSLKLLKENYSQIPDNAIGAVWFEQEYKSEEENFVMEAWYNLITEFTNLSNDTWTATNTKEHNMLREFRHTLPEKVFEIIVNNKTLKIGTDTAVPDEYAESYYKYIMERLKFYGLQHYIWGHIGNSHFHANVIVKTDEEVNNGYKFYDECIDEAIRLGGTVSAEHGIGKLKRKYFYRMFDKITIEKMKEIKRVFDPNDLFNRGNLFE